jgi:hypothetical protein
MKTRSDAGNATAWLHAPRRRRLALTLVPLLPVAVVVAIVLGTRSPSPSAADNASSVVGAATVQRRDLVETDTESGTLSYANPQTVYDRLTGTITWLPAVGQVIKPGQALFDVDGKPVILMDGSTPAYRDLKSSDSAGQDVLELNRNLVKLGVNPDGIIVDDSWQAATTAGVKALQYSLGETQSGSLSLGKVVFLPGNQLVSSVNATLGNAVSDPAPARTTEFVDLTTTTSTSTTSTSSTATGSTPTTTDQSPTSKRGTEGKSGKPRPGRKPGKSAKTLQALIALLEAEIAELKAQGRLGGGRHGGSSGGATGKSGSSGGSGKSGGSRGSGKSSSSGKSGNSGGSGGSGGPASATPVLQTTSTQLVVTVDLDASKQSEAKVGEPVTIELPAGNTVSGWITAVSPVAQTASSVGGSGGSGSGAGGGAGGSGGGGGSSNSSGATIPVTITLAGRPPGAGLDQASVSVSFVQEKANNVLSVPVTGLLATAGGGYAVQEAAAPHRLIPVTTGLFAAGYVQISGPGIYPGLQVTDSQG